MPSKSCLQYVKSDVVAAKFEYNDVSILICPQLKGANAVAFGPPGFPVFPNPFLLASSDTREQFDLLLTVDSKGHTTIVDLSVIRVRFSEELTLSPCSGEIVGARGQRQTIAVDRMTVEDDSVKVSLMFDVPKQKVDSIVVDIGTVTIDENELTLPPILYKNDPNLDYIPLAIGS